MNENPSLPLLLNLNDINTVLQALQELPAKIANPLTQEIRNQAENAIRQMREAEMPKPVEESVEYEIELVDPK